MPSQSEGTEWISKGSRATQKSSPFLGQQVSQLQWPEGSARDMGVRYRNGTGRDGAGWEGWGRLRRGSVRNPGRLLPQTPTFIAESVICCFEDAGGVIKRGGPLHPVDGPQPVHLFFRSHIVSHHLWEEVAGSGSQVQDTPLSPLPSSLKPPPRHNPSGPGPF